MTFDHLVEAGLGLLGLDPVSFYAMDIRDLLSAIRGRHRFEEMQERAKWERTRWLACVLSQPHTKKKLKPKDLGLFDWERKSGPKSEIAVLQQLQAWQD